MFQYVSLHFLLLLLHNLIMRLCNMAIRLKTIFIFFIRKIFTFLTFFMIIMINKKIM